MLLTSTAESGALLGLKVLEASMQYYDELLLQPLAIEEHSHWFCSANELTAREVAVMCVGIEKNSSQS